MRRKRTYYWKRYLRRQNDGHLDLFRVAIILSVLSKESSLPACVNIPKWMAPLNSSLWAHHSIESTCYMLPPADRWWTCFRLDVTNDWTLPCWRSVLPVGGGRRQKTKLHKWKRYWCIPRCLPEDRRHQPLRQEWLKIMTKWGPKEMLTIFSWWLLKGNRILALVVHKNKCIKNLIVLFSQVYRET